MNLCKAMWQHMSHISVTTVLLKAYLYGANYRHNPLDLCYSKRFPFGSGQREKKKGRRGARYSLSTKTIIAAANAAILPLNTTLNPLST